MAEKRVYLDVCALARPFDDQRQARIRIEASAVDLILSHVRQGRINLIVSPVHEEEIRADSDVGRRSHLVMLLQRLGTHFSFDPEITRHRTKQLMSLGLGVADAAHIALAEQAQAEFITVDDHLIKRYNRTEPVIWCGTPIAYCDKENLT